MEIGSNVTERCDLNAIPTEVVLVSRVEWLMEITDEVNCKAQGIAALGDWSRRIRSDSEKARYRSDHALPFGTIARCVEARPVARQIHIVKRRCPVPRCITADLVRPKTSSREIVTPEQFNDRSTRLGREPVSSNHADNPVTVLAPSETPSRHAQRCTPSASNASNSAM
jgi:hypothetical protein